jgi:hypothetical protein
MQYKYIVKSKRTQTDFSYLGSLFYAQKKIYIVR